MGFLISSQRDQIEVIIAGNNLNVRDLSGRREFSESKVPTVLDFFLGLSPRLLASYGVNFMTTIPCSEPERWIRDNILAAQISVKTKKTLLGGTVVLKIAADPKTWNIKLEPGGNNRMNITFNADEDIREIPNPVVRLRQEMEEQLESMLRLLSELGL